MVVSSDHLQACVVDCSSETASTTTVISLWSVGVSIHWTGLLEWTTGMDYWTHPNFYKIPFKCITKLNVLIRPVTLLMLVP